MISIQPTSEEHLVDHFARTGWRVVAERFHEESARVVGLDVDGGTVRWLDDRESCAALGPACDVADSIWPSR